MAVRTIHVNNFLSYSGKAIALAFSQREAASTNAIFQNRSAKAYFPTRPVMVEVLRMTFTG